MGIVKGKGWCSQLRLKCSHGYRHICQRRFSNGCKQSCDSVTSMLKGAMFWRVQLALPELLKFLELKVHFRAQSILQQTIGPSGVHALPVAVAEEQLFFFLRHILFSQNVLCYDLKFGTELSVTKKTKMLGEKQLGGTHCPLGGKFVRFLGGHGGWEEGRACADPFGMTPISTNAISVKWTIIQNKAFMIKWTLFPLSFSHLLSNFQLWILTSGKISHTFLTPYFITQDNYCWP